MVGVLVIVDVREGVGLRVIVNVEVGVDVRVRVIVGVDDWVGVNDGLLVEVMVWVACGPEVSIGFGGTSLAVADGIGVAVLAGVRTCPHALNKQLRAINIKAAAYTLLIEKSSTRDV